MSNLTNDSIPTLYEWAGGIEALEKLTETFYQRVAIDPVLSPIFAHMSGEHPRHVAAFIAEVFGGPSLYTERYGGSHAGMVAHHLNRHLTEEQRRRWINLLIDSADAVGLPDDPEFRSAFVAYIEWGTRLAVLNSQPGAEGVDPEAPMPSWNWGAVGGPYVPKEG